MPGNFFDANVILYTASRDSMKADRAEEIVAAGGVVSVQVLNEIANVARRKMQLSWDELDRLLAGVKAVMRIEPVTLTTHDTGLKLARRYHFSVYDSMVVAAALLADCNILWSEDMQDGLLVDSRLRIVNPFNEV